MSQNRLKRHQKSGLVFSSLIVATLAYGLLMQDNTENQVDFIKLSQPLAQITEAVPLHRLSSDKKENSSEVKREAVLMGSHFIFVVDAPKQQALAAITAAANSIKQLEMKLSSWHPASDISRLNERAGRNAVQVSADTLKLLQIAKQLAQRTGGAFDVTVGPLWDIWPFRQPQADMPSADNIKQTLPLVAASTIELDAAAGTAYLPTAGMKVNLGAIGKGYAAEVAITTMKQFGIERAAVSAGGDLYLLGQKSSGPWLVELPHPRWQGHILERFLAADTAVATSGDSQQFIEREGVRYGHIIDPRSGWPANDCQSVTIVSRSATEADAYATAVYVMGTVEGLLWVEQQAGVEALIVDKNGLIHRSSGWLSQVKNAHSKQQTSSHADTSEHHND